MCPSFFLDELQWDKKTQRNGIRNAHWNNWGLGRRGDFLLLSTLIDIFNLLSSLTFCFLLVSQTNAIDLIGRYSKYLQKASLNLSVLKQY